jgi:diguanylate cyclase
MTSNPTNKLQWFQRSQIIWLSGLLLIAILYFSGRIAFSDAHFQSTELEPARNPMLSHSYKSSNMINLKDRDAQINLSPRIKYIEDPEHTLSFEDLVKLPDSEWQVNQKNSVNFGYSSSSYWLKLSLRNDDVKEIDKMLVINYPVLDHLNIYFLRHGAVEDHYQLGDKLPFYQRLIQNRNFLIPIDMNVSETVELYFQVKTTSSVQLPMTLWNHDEYHQQDQTKMLFQGLYFGITLVMILYNLFVYIAVSEKMYLQYVLFIASMSFFLASLNGLTFQYIWPNATWWNDQAIIIFLNGVICFGLFFSLDFLNITKSSHPRIHLLMTIAASLAAIVMFLGLLLNYHLLIRPTIYLAFSACGGILFVGIYRWLQGEWSAKYYTIAWFFMLSGGIVLGLNKFTVLPQNTITENATQIGSALEIVLLSIALAARLNREKRRTFKAQSEALAKEREAHLTMEKNVQIRTKELEEANKKLQELSATDALTGLKNRGHFEERYTQAFVSGYRLQQPVSVVMIDVDHFKKFNDSYGHSLGDECLKQVAKNLSEVLFRPQDLVARYGGEEFIALLPDTPDYGAQQVAENMRAQIAQMPFQLADETLHVTVSIGVATQIPASTTDQQQLIDLADAALYQAKEAGRNCVYIAEGKSFKPSSSNPT